MASLSGYDQNAEAQVEFKPIPEGIYLAAIEESDKKENKKKTGEYLALKFKILNGEYKGRTVNANLNIWHPDETVAKIANSEFAAIREATGVLAPKDSQQLHGIPVEIKVVVTAQNDQGKVFNNIKAYYKRGTNSKPAAQAPEETPDWM